MKGNKVEKEPAKAIIHIEAEMGSSILDLRIENADAVQLFGAAELLRTQGMAALAAQMQMAANSQHSPLQLARRLPHAGN